MERNTMRGAFPVVLALMASAAFAAAAAAGGSCAATHAASCDVFKSTSPSGGTRALDPRAGMPKGIPHEPSARFSVMRAAASFEATSNRALASTALGAGLAMGGAPQADIVCFAPPMPAPHFAEAANAAPCALACGRLPATGTQCVPRSEFKSCDAVALPQLLATTSVTTSPSQPAGSKRAAAPPPAPHHCFAVHPAASFLGGATTTTCPSAPADGHACRFTLAAGHNCASPCFPSGGGDSRPIAPRPSPVSSEPPDASTVPRVPPPEPGHACPPPPFVLACPRAALARTQAGAQPTQAALRVARRPASALGSPVRAAFFPAPAGEPVVNVTPRPRAAAGAYPRPALAVLFLILLCSTRRSASRRDPPLSSILTLSALALLATASANPACTRVAASTGEVVTLCAPTSSSAPSSGHSVNFHFTMGSSGSGLSATSATLNGVDVLASFSDAGGGVYNLQYTTPVGGTMWPWAGLELHAALTDNVTLTNFTAVVVPGLTWIEQAGSRGMETLGSGGDQGTCMGDVDGDGDVDMFVGHGAAHDNQLWINDGSGSFEEQAEAWKVVGVASHDVLGCGFGDADGDGLLDLMVTRYQNDRNQLYMNTGTEFVEEADARGVAAADNSAGLSWGDVDGDADLDLFVCWRSKQNKLYINNGEGVFAEESGVRGLGSISRDSRQSALVDIDGDSDLDLLVANWNSANELYVNNGTGVFEELGTSRGFTNGGKAHALAVGDWSGDGAVDAYVSNEQARDVLALNDGSGSFSDVTSGRGVSASGWNSRPVSMFDIEGDGDLDIYVGVNGGEDMVWVNTGAGWFSNGQGLIGLGSGTPTVFASTGDIDGDGDVDVVVPSQGDLYVSQNAQPGVPRVVVVRPLTAAGAQSAFGAVVRVECVDGCGTEWVGVRVIDGGSSRHSQNGYDAVVGVLVPSATYNVSVRWAGDAHPPSNWTTHPGLGGIVPSTLSTPASRLFVVRSFPLTASVGYVLPWDYPGVSIRSGEPASTPVAGDTVLVPIQLSQDANTHDVNVTATVVNGQGVHGNWTGSELVLAYTTEAGWEMWPWEGLHVRATLVDSCGVVTSVIATAIPGSTWSEEGGARGVSGLGLARGVCMGDVDGDGDVDVFVASDSGAQNQLWMNGGGGAFDDDAAVAWNVAGDAAHRTQGCGFGDADGDGLLDLFVTRYVDDVNNLYMNTGTGFVEDGGERGVGGGDDSYSVAWGDVDGDGDLDVFVGNLGRVNDLYMNDGLGMFTEEGVSRGVGAARNTMHSVLADIDGDGDLDVLVATRGSANELYVNNGTGVFEEVGVERGFADSSTALGIAVGDWSGDGMLDVYVSDSISQDLLYVNDGSGAFVEVGVGLGGGPPSVAGYGVSMLDVENDADLDIVVGVSGDADLVWVNDGGTRFDSRRPELNLGSSASNSGLAAGDIDGDGDVDVVMPVSGAVFVSHSSRPGVPRVVVVRPLTTSGAQSAFGAVVRVDCVDGCEEAWAGVRLMECGSGYFSQNAYDAVVGVPAPSATYNMSVRWAGDAHPPSNWTTHPGLGGVVPSTLSTPASRLFVVRPFPLAASLGGLLLWDYPGVGTRSGQGPSAPTAGDTLAIPIALSPTQDVTISHAFVNGQDVSGSWAAPTAGGKGWLTYVTEEGREGWPWESLNVSVRLVDSGGLVTDFVSGTVPGSTWSEESGARGLSTLADKGARGVCMGDVDGDGDLDVFVAMVTGDLNQLWVNGGGGAFTDVAAAWNVTGAESDFAYGCGFGDADGDGMLDLMVTRFNNDVNELYMNSGSGFVEEGGARGVADGADDGFGLTWGDVDGDGDLDVFVCGGVHLLLVNDGRGWFSEEASARGAVKTGGLTSQQSAMADIDGDGDVDVLVVHFGNPNQLFVNNGTGWFTESGADWGFNDTALGRGIAVGDWSGDGAVDVYVSNQNDRDLLYINGGGAFAEVGAERGVPVSTQSNYGVSMLDVEGDGDLDIVSFGDWVDEGVVLVNGGGGGFSDGSDILQLGTPAAVATLGVSAGDIDGDGDVDIITSSSGSLHVNHNAQPGLSRVVVVRPLTVGGAQSAFGAVVRVGCVDGCGEEWVGVRVIDGGSSYSSQNGYDAVVGVPAPSATYNMSVRWVGDVHPVANWTTHPRLGGVVPSSLSTAASRLFVVRPRPAALSVEFLPWDYAGVTYRTGEPSPPASNDTVVIPILVARTTSDLTAVSATVNGQDVRLTFLRASPGLYTLEYTTVVGQEAWPWAGLGVELSVVDSGGLMSVLSTAVVPGNTFAPAISSTGLGTLPSSSAGVCVGDIDGDGDADVVVGVAGDADLLFVNSGGVFVVLLGAFPGSAATSGCALGDVDGDGDLDVLFAVDGSDRLFIQSPPVVFGEEGVARGVGTGGDSRSAVWGDVDADGDIDVFVCVHDGQHVLAVNGGSGDFGDGAVAAGVATVTLCEQAIMVDVDDDADVDILVVNGVQADELFVNSGLSSGSFLERGSTRGFTAAGDSRALVAGDVSGDGHIDVVVAQASSGTLVFVNDGEGVFSEEGGGRGVGTVGTMGSALVDIEHDGDLDMVMGRMGGLSGVVLGNNGGGVFSDRSLDLGVGPSASRVAVVDFDSDGDMDFVFSNGLGVYENFAADGGVANWVRVRPLTPGGGQSAFGAVVRVVCAEGCLGAWSGVRVIGGGGLHGQQSYDAHFGLPVGGAAFDVEVVFVGGATHDKGTDPALGGVVPGSVVDVVDRPYVAGVTAVYSDSDSDSVGILGVNGTVTVVITAGQRQAGLVPGPGCCMVNGVNVTESFVDGGGGSYNLTYVLGEGDGEWGDGELVVVPTLQSTVSMIEVEFVLGGSPAGDPVSPVIVYDCRPGTASANVYERVCVRCPFESVVCNFSYVVHSASLGVITASVPAVNYTSPTSASFVVGPFNDTDMATLTVFATDGAGNVNATEGLSWRVDTSSPVTTLVNKPDPVTSRPDANFALQCSEVVCSFEYRFNGGPLTALGGNETVGDVPVVDTVMVTGPGWESPVAAPLVSFAMNVSDASMWVNASVSVDVDGMKWELPVVDNVTEVLQLPTLGDGEHVLTAVGRGGDGTSDVTPIYFVFTVDTAPPGVSVLDAPVDGARGNPAIVVDAEEEDCVFEWRAGPSPLNGSWVATSSAILVPEVTSSVPHTFEVRAIDPAGNVGPAASTSWMPSSCPDTIPDVVVTSEVGVSVGQRYVTFGVVGGAAWGDFEYVLDGGDWVASGSKKVILDGVGLGGDHELRVRAAVPSECNSELAGSRPSAQVVTWTEPAPLPLQVTMSSKPDPSTPDVFAEFELLGSRRSRVWFEYSLDGERWAPTGALLRVGPLQAGSHSMRVRALGSDGVSSGDVQSHSWVITAASDSSIVLTNLPDGDHSLLVIATDEAGSFEVAPNTYEWRVDTTPPTVAANRTSPRFSSSRTAVVDVSCGGEIDDCEFCWTSDAVPRNCSSTSPLFVTASEDGYHVVDVRAVDSVGLESVEGVGIEWTVDSTPPVVTVADVDGVLVPARYDAASVDGVLGNTSLRLSLTANEDVLGFDVTLNGGVVGEGGVVDAILELADLPVMINRLVVSCTDLAGNVAEDVLLRVLVDVTPPRTLPFTTPPPPLTAASGVSVGVAGEDGVSGSGVDVVAVSLLDDSGGVVDVMLMGGASGTVEFTSLTTGVYNVTAVSVDVAGNVEETGVVATVVVDHVPPVSAFGEGVSAFHSSPNLTVWVAASEAGQQFARVVGAAGWVAANASGAATLTALSDANHTVEVRSVDLAGNEELEPYASAGVVDTVAPVLYWTTGVDGFTSMASVSRCFAANDSSPVALSASPTATVLHGDNCFELGVVDDGAVAVNVTGTDAAGNVGDVATTSWVLDRVPPSSVITSSIVSSSPACVNGSVTVCDAPTSATLAVACDDGSPSVAVSPCRPQYAVSLVEATSGVGCAVPASARRRLSTDGFVDAPTTPFTLDTVDGDGLYVVAVRSVDAAGNVEAGNTTLTWFVDTATPASAPTLVQTPDKVVSSTTALFVIQLSDDNSPGQTAFFFKLDDGQETQVSDLPFPNTVSVQLEVTGLAEGDHKVEVWARDQAGNDGPFVLYDWAIATEAPGVDILSTPAAISADVTPSFVFQAVWTNGSRSGSGVEPLAGIEVTLSGGDATFATVCEDTVLSGGVCVWNASLADRGEGTYTVNVRAVFGGNAGDPAPHTWSYTLCSDDQYAVVGDDGGIECFSCPPGGDCSGRRTSQADIAAVQGFWAPPGSSGLRFYECPVEEACLPGGDVVVGNSTLRVVSQCNEGYTGTLCAVCEDGFFEQFGLCVSCGTQSGVAWLIMFAVLVAVIGVGVLFFRFRSLMPIDQLKVTLSMVQIIASANTAYDIPWPPLFADFLNTMRVFLIEAVSLTRANCAQPMTFYGSLTVTLVAFKVVLLLVVFGPVLLHKWKQRGRQHTMPPPAPLATRPAAQQEAPQQGQRRRRRSSIMQSMVAVVHAAQAVDWAKIFKITFLFLFVAYPGVSLKIMKTFKCVEVEGEYWLVADMRLKCYEGDWFGYALYAFVMGCLYTAGLPLAISVILWRNRGRLGEGGVVAKWGFLYETYGVGAYLWEVVELSRKLWLSALVVLMAEGSPLQVTVAVLISGWAHVLHAVYKPWRGVGDSGTSVYALQHGSLFVTCFVFLMGLLFKVEGVSQDGDTYNVLAWAMLLACVGFLVAAAFVLVTAVATQLHRTRLKVTATVSRNGVQQPTRNALSARTGRGPPLPGGAYKRQRPGASPHAVRKGPSGDANGHMMWVRNPAFAPQSQDGKALP